MLVICTDSIEGVQQFWNAATPLMCILRDQASNVAVKYLGA